MIKIKNWIVEEKKHVRFYHEWNDKEVTTYACVCLKWCVCWGGMSLNVWCCHLFSNNNKTDLLSVWPLHFEYFGWMVHTHMSLVGSDRRNSVN